MIILDTNVPPELLRPTPAPQIEAWLAAQDGGKRLLFTAVGEAVLQRGAANLPAGWHHTVLGTAIDEMLDKDFRDCILPFGHEAARAYGASVATRNIDDHEGCDGVSNPWDKAKGRQRG